MSVWTELDALVKKHKEQRLTLRALAKEGGAYRVPRFRPPCVWTLRPCSSAPKTIETKVCVSFDEAYAALEVHALRMREVRRLREEAEAKERAAKAAKKARRSR